MVSLPGFSFTFICLLSIVVYANCASYIFICHSHHIMLCYNTCVLWGETGEKGEYRGEERWEWRGGGGAEVRGGDGSVYICICYSITELFSIIADLSESVLKNWRSSFNFRYCINSWCWAIAINWKKLNNTIVKVSNSFSLSVIELGIII